MHAEVQRAELSKALSQIAKVVETRHHIPILSHVVLTAADGALTARGTDLDIEITATVPATVHGQGTACVPARNLYDIVKRLAGDTVSLELEPGSVADTGTLTIKAGRSRFKLPSVPSKSMPTLAGATFDATFTADLAALFAPVAFAASASDPQRPCLEGVYLHAHDGKLRAVGADGARMAIHDTDLPEDAAGMPGVVVPGRVVGMLPKGAVDLRVGKSMISVTADGTALTAKLIEQPYLQYERGLPQGCDKVVRLDKAEFADAVGRVSIVTADISGKPVRVYVATGAVTLKAADKDGRDAVDEVPTEYDGAEVSLAFQSGLLSDMLAAAPGEVVDLAIKDAVSFSRMTVPGNDNWVGVMGSYRVAV